MPDGTVPVVTVRGTQVCHPPVAAETDASSGPVGLSRWSSTTPFTRRGSE
ncbi:MAG TPA: hypothetical protein VHT91_44865 [Kofleriaceae bacterium]|jgi:hypothetical protein|nr:hypothetical protein [Kofleriaceae bacterium]